MGQLTKSVLQRIANKLRGVSIEPIGPNNHDEFADRVDEVLRRGRSSQKRPHEHSILGAAFNEATDASEHVPGKGGYLALDEDKNVVGGVAFHPRVHPQALSDPTLLRYLEELGAWPGEIQYLSSSRPGVGTALFQAARANMMDQRDDIDTVLMSLKGAVPFYRDKVGMMPMEIRMRDLLEPQTDPSHLLWFNPLSHLDHSLPPWDDMINAFSEGGRPIDKLKKTDHRPAPAPLRSFSAGIRG